MPFFTKLLTTFSILYFLQPAYVLAIEEVPNEAIEQRAEEAKKLYQPLMEHAENIPDTVDPDTFDSGMSMSEIMMLMNSADPQRLILLDQKLGDSVKSVASDQIIEWLTRQNALELNLLSKLESYVGNNSECASLINIYRAKITSANESTIEHLKRYKDSYKLYNFPDSVGVHSGLPEQGLYKAGGSCSNQHLR